MIRPISGLYPSISVFRLCPSICGKALLFRGLKSIIAATPPAAEPHQRGSTRRKSKAFPHIERQSPRKFGTGIFLLCALFLASCSRYPSSTLIFITNERSGTITVIDSTTDKIIDTIPVGGRPRGIRIGGSGRFAYVAVSAPFKDQTAKGFDRVIVLDTSTGKIHKSIDVGADPEQLAVDPDERHVYVSNEDDGTATVVDIETGAPVAVLVTGIEPEGVTSSPDGRWVYVMAETSSTVTVIDAEKQKVVNTFLVGTRPRDAAFSPDGRRAYISAEIGKDLSVVDVATHTVIETVWAIDEVGVAPVGVVVSPDGKRIYLANGRGNSVSIFDAESFDLIKTIAVGQRVWGIGLTPDGKKLYAANGLSNDVSVIDTGLERVVARIPAGDGPWGVAVR
jgi:PQQ-dependent catabolism-associated beta-propeller protein